jgi:hypothetical protein
MALIAKRVYVRIAEKALGHPLPVGALVHHVDENRSHNVPSNLVILQSAADHRALHRRLRIRKAGGNPWSQQICCTCHIVKDLSAFPPSRRKGNGSWTECLPCSANRNAIRYGLKVGRLPQSQTHEERVAQGWKNAMKRWHPELLCL